MLFLEILLIRPATKSTLNRSSCGSFLYEVFIVCFKKIFYTFPVFKKIYCLRCKTCGGRIYKGRKLSVRKEYVENESYLGIQIYRFYFKVKTNFLKFLSVQNYYFLNYFYSVLAVCRK